jgi:hypothetical protein
MVALRPTKISNLIRRQPGGRECGKVDENFRNTNTKTELGLILRPEKPEEIGNPTRE